MYRFVTVHAVFVAILSVSRKVWLSCNIFIFIGVQFSGAAIACLFLQHRIEHLRYLAPGNRVEGLNQVVIAVDHTLAH